MERIVFSIDNPFDLHTLAKFYRHVDTARAMGNLSGTMEMCVGSWDGNLEPSFAMLKHDFDKLKIKSMFCQGQEAFMFLSSDDRQPVIIRDYNGNFLSSGNPVVSHIKGEDFTLVIRTGNLLTLED